MKAVALAVLAALAVGCGAPPAATEPPGDHSAASDGGTVASQLPPPAFHYPIAIPATQVALPSDSHLAIDGDGAGRVRHIAVADGAGTIDLDGRAVAVAAYLAIDDPPFTLYQALAVEPDRLWVMWFYCLDGALSTVYVENTAGVRGQFTDASGTCSVSAGPSTVNVAFPALSIASLALEPQYRIDGALVRLSGANPGTLFLDRGRRDLLVFDTVDCSACASPGWMELHSLVFSEEDGELYFCILYLEQALPREVAVQYIVRLRDMDMPEGFFAPASWTISPAPGLAAPAPLFRPRPPSFRPAPPL
jgi:hypothetical protein